MTRVQVYRDQFELLSGPFTQWPDLPCLVCKLSPLEPDIVPPFESKKSLDVRVGAEIWDGRKSGFFHGELNCSRSMCGNKYAIAGEWNRGPDDPADEVLDDDGSGLVGFIVKHILPPLPLIEFPDGVPVNVMASVESASSVLLSDPSAAATRMRVAIDALMDEQGVRKTKPNKRSQRMETHHRIMLFQNKNKEAVDFLMAMKNIGNVGSHERIPLPLGFVLAGIEHFAKAIELIYDRQDIQLIRQAAEINRRGGRLRATSLQIGLRGSPGTRRP